MPMDPPNSQGPHSAQGPPNTQEPSNAQGPHSAQLPVNAQRPSNAQGPLDARGPPMPSGDNVGVSGAPSGAQGGPWGQFGGDQSPPSSTTRGLHEKGRGLSRGRGFRGKQPMGSGGLRAGTAPCPASPRSNPQALKCQSKRGGLAARPIVASSRPGRRDLADINQSEREVGGASPSQSQAQFRVAPLFPSDPEVLLRELPVRPRRGLVWPRSCSRSRPRSRCSHGGRDRP